MNLRALLLMPTIMVCSMTAQSQPEEHTLNLLIGKSTVIPLTHRILRLSVGQAQVADVMLLGRHDLYLIGKSAGTTNVLLWQENGPVQVFNINVERDVEPLLSRLRLLLPEEQRIQVSSSGESVVLAGAVSDVIRAEQAIAIAQSFLTRLPGTTNPTISTAAVTTPAMVLPANVTSTAHTVPGVTMPAALNSPHIINLLTVAEPAQIMLEVKVAEVSRLLMDELGASVQYQKSGGPWSFGVLSNLLTQGPAQVTFNRALSVTLDGQHSDGLIKILAEPTLMALSGQEAHFLAGGKILIPTSTPNGMGGSLVTLTEQEYGVSLHFLPKVLEGGHIWLTVTPEVSELNPQGVNISSGPGLAPTILPSFTTRRASTTVQLKDGEHFVIGGLVRNNVNATLNAIPFLGEIPLLGTLFRSPNFQTDKTELVFVVTPHLVIPSHEQPDLPTDHYREPSVTERMLGGHLESKP